MKVRSVEEFIEMRARGVEDIFRVDATDEVWRSILEEHPDLGQLIAKNKTLSTELIRELAENSDSMVRWAIASKRKTPPDVLKRLAFDADESVRKRVALNPKVTREILMSMVDDEWEGVREAVAKRLAEMGEPTA